MIYDLMQIHFLGVLTYMYLVILILLKYTFIIITVRDKKVATPYFSQISKICWKKGHLSVPHSFPFDS